MKALIVDDIQENRYLLETLLHGHGHSTMSAGTGIEAMQRLRSDAFDLIISDVLMPGMDGFAFCRATKRDEWLRHIPFVFYTATYTDTRDVEFGLSLGADRYLIKPIEPDALLATLNEVLAAPRPVTPPLLGGDRDPVYLKEYNSRLVAKLEKKMLDLHATHEALKAELAVRERLDGQLRQAQKMEAIGRMAGGLAHDFNNILGGILGFADLALAEPDASPAIQSHLEGIVAASQRAKELVQQLLTFSRRKECKRQPLHLQAALADVLKLLRASLPAGIELRTSFDPAAPPIVADLTELHQIVTNLVTNAWHAIESDSGIVELKVEVTEVEEKNGASDALKPARYVCLSVHDNGCGMDERTLEHIFEPFFSTKALGKGSGLGLAVVHGIVESCGGSISVESAPGQGSTFRLFFPAHAGETAPATAVPVAASKGKGQRVLFIDDDHTLAALGEQFLTRLGYQAVAFVNPMEALEQFRQESFDLVITDLTMPYRNGLEVAHECASIHPEVPVIVTTGYNPAISAEEIRQQGVAHILLKPYNIQSLAESVAAALKKK